MGRQGVYTDQGQDVEVDLGENDYLFMTLGSIRADSSYAGRISVPELIRDRSFVAYGVRVRGSERVIDRPDP